MFLFATDEGSPKDQKIYIEKSSSLQRSGV